MRLPVQLISQTQIQFHGRLALTILTVILGLWAQCLRADPAFWKHEFPQTDFTQTSVENWTEILSGGPGRDGIPALSDPRFLTVQDETRLGAREPVIAVELDGAPARAYPLRYLTWHEIVNDEVAGRPIAVTFCPLCNSAMVFDRRVKGQVLSFGVTGKLRNSDMVMYDRETESWWQQALGTGIVGVHTDTQLEQLPSWMESWAEFAARNPDGKVMDQPQARRAYGRNPYVGYDSRTRPYPFFTGELPPNNVPALARVVRVGDRAWPVSRLAKSGEIKEAGITISWVGGQASALDDGRIANGRDVGTIRVRDAQGRDLPHDVLFAFAFHAFWPEGTWMLGF
ncbi:DUF3179 domain-containing protein [Aliiroseovarius crassostreae]|uniref:DUF3179 domain-containing protein n=1 Tax=Aliiroseovarius crassostreae TaxID=154981 RepID=UPI0022095CAF|nr:DUF3179 domain-containing protein [Aliiroseovarius crassostreae]UWQ06208.1 DUF3179 domain-containing protein [Aliiroseovarius crassostreae]